MRRFVLLLLILLWASASHAVTITYTDSASFLAALPGAPTTMESEGVAAGTLLPSGSSLDGITFTYSIPPETLEVANAFDTTSGSNSLGLTSGDSTLLEDDVVTFGLASAVNAFGLFVIASDAVLANEIKLATSVGTASGSGTAETVLADGGIVYFQGLDFGYALLVGHAPVQQRRPDLLHLHRPRHHDGASGAGHLRAAPGGASRRRGEAATSSLRG